MTGAQPRVRFTSSLKAKLDASSAQVAATIKAEFLQWKANPQVDHPFFGKDGFNRGSTKVRHVHLRPTIVKKEREWDVKFTDQRKRTSDRYLFYVDGGFSQGYLLIDIIDDPGAHKIWDAANKQVRLDYEACAQRFIDLPLTKKVA